MYIYDFQYPVAARRSRDDIIDRNDVVTTLARRALIRN